MKKLIVANWKANPKTFTEALKLAKASDFKNTVLAPPFIYLQTVSWVLKRADICAQDVFWQESGSYTGEITPVQLKNLKIKYVIIGHSERRQLGETDEMINRKIKASLKVGLNAILCVGENWPTRRKGIVAAKKFVANQLKKDLHLITKQLLTNKLIVAYEPIWAIGTGKADTPENSAEIINYTRELLSTYYKLQATVLYGGSINAGNAFGFLSRQGIDGALVGGASLSPQSFKAIIKARDSI